MLTITKKADYGLLLLTSLAKSPSQDFIALKRIAAESELPYKFLSQIAASLKGAGIIESKEGLGGGYRLKNAPDQITIDTIINTLDGPIAPTGCLRGKKCKYAPMCGHQQIMKKVGQLVQDSLAKYSVADLISQ
jgi:Rrf2 family protein